MSRFRLITIPVLTLAVSLLLASPLASGARADDAPIVSGTYQLDPNHASVTFKIDHLGFSHYTGRFDKMEATLNLNAAAPEQSSLNVTVYPNSIDTDNQKLEETLRTENWFNVIKYPRATFQSTKIERTSPTTAKVTGDFTLMGVTHSLTLDATLIGHGPNPMNKNQVIGFSATGSFKRSDYGLSNLLPLVGDNVTLEIEAEFDKTE